jgi:diguanylate cyclase (GGDEF)-like protein
MVSAPFVLETRQDAQRAQAVDREVPALTETVGALAAVAAEQGVAESALYGVESGFSFAIVDAVLGVSLQKELRSAESATDRATVASGLSVARKLLAELAPVRALVNSSRAASAIVDSRYREVESTLEATAAVALTHVEEKVPLASGSTTVNGSLLALGLCYHLVQATAAQAQDDTAVFFGAPGTRKAAMIRLAKDNALVDEAGQQIASSGVPAVTKTWATLVINPAVVEYNAFMVDAEQGMTLPYSAGKLHIGPGTVSFATMVGAVRGIPEHWRLISNLVAQASSTVRLAASSLATASTRTYQLWVLLVALAAVAALAVAVVTARSISRPLGRLAGTARSVVAGHLDVEHLATNGPTETAVVADAFNSLMSNLRLLEAKAQALATCDFDNEVLSVPLPGQLGASLQDSVTVLAGSIQDRHQLQERLAHEATHDTLTGLLNRAAAISTLEQALARARRRGDMTAVLYIDLDNFKQANDLHGHQSGDHVLRQVGARLSGAVRAGDILARLGGDEFVVIAERVEDASEVESLAERLVGALSDPVEWGTVRLSVGASVGITLAHGDGPGALELLARADLALYRAKQRGGRGIEVYDVTLQERLAERDGIERSLHDELGRGGGGLVLYYQPLVDANRTLCGVEALLRWDRAGEGLLLPDRFIPIAEASDLIIEVDKWVLAAAARQVAAWATEPVLSALNVSVNISGRHLLSQRLPGHLQQVLAASGIEPHQLGIEITETVLLGDLTTVAAELEAVRRLGVRVAVDDFGTGYTSLAHLNRLPIDTIKIARSFVADIESPKDASLVRMITELAHQLGLTTVSEGVETTQQLHALQALGSDQIQGYLIARPMPPEWLRGWTSNEYQLPRDLVEPVGAPPG